MEYTDLRDWLEKVEGFGELKTINGAHWDKEMGAINEVTCKRQAEPPAILFDQIPGYPPRYRCLFGMLNSPKRQALTLGLPIKDYASKMELLSSCHERLKEVTLIPRKYVPDGPVLENIHMGDEVNLYEFPVPLLHEKDGGRFIGTGNTVITQDRDTGWINLGVYRMQVIDEKRAFSNIVQGHHGWLHRAKYLDRGEPCPMAIAVGVDPLLLFVASSKVPQGVSEYAYAGAIRGAPVEVIKGPVTGLPIPARAEIVLEGEVIPEETGMEGPFGEWPGYYASMRPRPRPIFIAKGIMHRNDPILTCVNPGKPPSDYHFQESVIRSLELWRSLERADVPDVRGVWVHEAGGGRSFVVISIKQRFHGHSRQAGILSSQFEPAAWGGRWIIVVDDDIDPSNQYDVVWALSTRCDPAEDIEIIRKCWSGGSDPMALDRPAASTYNSRAVVDACIPFDRIEEFPEAAEFSSEYRGKILEKWGDELFG